mgnify:CR=1 FL=1
MQLKTKLLVYITVPIALAVCISSYMTYRTHSAAMRHVIEKDIKATSFFVAENINLTISDIKNSFRVAAKSETIKASLENTGQREHERVVAFFEAIKHVMPTITDVFLLDENGNIREEARNMVMGDLKAHFRPEFLNRLDEMILFKPLTKDNISRIVDLCVADVNKRLADRELKLRLTDAAKVFITDHGYDPVYGARPLKRYLQKNVETLAARIILADGVGEGSVIVIDVDPQGDHLTAKAE